MAKGILYLHTFDVTKITVDSQLCGIKLIHGDLKPVIHFWWIYHLLTSPQLNVLVDDNGVAKICDFGLLRLVREHAPTGMTTTSSHTGTIRYLSYELVSDNPNESKPTTASDVYALACIGMQVSRFSLRIELDPNNSALSSSTRSLRMPIFPTEEHILNSR